MKKLLILIILLGCFVGSFACAEEPQRSKGISVYALPKRVANISGKPWGFEVAYAPYLRPEPGQPYLQSLSDVLEYIKKQDSEVVKNGFWVVTTNPLAYSDEELKIQEQIKIELPKNHIPLFWARGAEIEQGFKKY
jgi:hypothetical protein